jgi:nucleolar protein 58
LKDFGKFQDTADALSAATAIVEGKVSKNLKKFLKKAFKKSADEKLAVSDLKLASSIKEKLGIDCVHDPAVLELFRGIRANLSDLISDNLEQSDLQQMVLGLSHSLSRYKLKFSPDKVDTMIVQAICTFFHSPSSLHGFLKNFIHYNLCYYTMYHYIITKKPRLYRSGWRLCCSGR